MEKEGGRKGTRKDGKTAATVKRKERKKEGRKGRNAGRKNETLKLE